MIFPEPYEFIDLLPGAQMSLRVERIDDGSVVIHPRNPSARHVRQHMEQNGLTTAPPDGTPIGVEVPMLRLYGQRLDELSAAPYFDVSSKTLRADLLARIRAGQQMPFSVTLQAFGAAPRKRYSVTIGPA